MSFCDTSFAIGESFKDKSLRYVKQIKVRNSEPIYDGDNVAVCQIIKPANFLHFEFLEFGREKDHLKEMSEKENEALAEKVKHLHQQGKSFREIGSMLGFNHMKASRIINPKKAINDTKQ